MNLMEQFKAAMARYDAAVADNKPEDAEAALAEAEGLKAQIDAEKKAADLKAWQKEIPNPAPVPNVDTTPVDDKKTETRVEFARVNPVTSFKAAGNKSAEERAYRFGKYVLASVGNQDAAKWCHDNGVELKVHQEAVNTTGGFLVPAEFSNDIIDLTTEYGSFRRNVGVTPMASDTKSIPRKTGGLTAYWVAESGLLTESTAAWDRVQLVAKKLAALTSYSSEVGEDATIDFGNTLAREISMAFAYAEDVAGWNGTGISTHGKIIGVKQTFLNLTATRANIAGLKVATTNTKTAWSNPTLADHHAVMGKLPTRFRNGAKWFCNPTYFDEVMARLAAAAGGNSIQTIQGGVTTPAFLGYPVEFVDVMPGVPTADVPIAYFGRLSDAAKMGDRRQTTLAVSTEYRYAYDEIAIRGTERVDIVVHDVGNESATAASRVPGPLVGLLADA